MKKLFFACALAVGTLGLYSCGGNTDTTTTEESGTVIERDTSVSELEVQETVVDTTTNTETIETDTSQAQQ